MKNRKRRNRVFILFILLLTVSIGFAALSTQLSVVGTTGISKNTWSVYWANVGNESGIVPTTSPTISNEDETHPNTVISFGVTLAEPGDYYEFEVDAVNNGTIDAMLTGVTTNITSNGVSATLPSYILYSVKYSDGEEPGNKHLLSKKSGNTPTKERYKIRIEFSRDITKTQLDEMPNDGLSYDVDIEASYVQADNTAIVRPKDYLKVMTSANGDTQPAFDNNKGIKKNQVEKVYTLDTVTLPSELQDEMIESWDVSARSNSSIMAYALDTDSNSKYEIYLAQEGGVKANPNSTKLFNFYSNITDIDVTNLITDDVENMLAMFQGEDQLINILGMENWSTGRVTNMKAIFNQCANLTSINISSFDTGEVTDMSYMFNNCSKLTSLDLSSFNTSKVTNMERMFSLCSSLTSLDLSSFNTSKVTSMEHMFISCSKLSSLDLSNFDMSKTTNAKAMLQGVGFKNIIMSNNYIKLDIFMFNHNSSYNQESFTISKSVKTVGNSHIFYDFGNTNFKKFIVEEGSTTLKTIDDLLYTYDGTKLLSIPNGKTFTDNTYVMPDSVTTLNTMCFNRTQKIDKVVISDNLVIDRYYDDTSSGDSDPVKGNRLNTGIYVYTSVKEYEAKETNANYSSYGGCIYNKAGTELISVPVKYTGVLNIKDGATTIGREAFWVQRVSHITNITEINIPASVTTIEANQLTTLNKLITNGVVINIDSNNASYEISNNQIVAK